MVEFLFNESGAQQEGWRVIGARETLSGFSQLSGTLVTETVHLPSEAFHPFQYHRHLLDTSVIAFVARESLDAGTLPLVIWTTPRIQDRRFIVTAPVVNFPSELPPPALPPLLLAPKGQTDLLTYEWAPRLREGLPLEPRSIETGDETVSLRHWSTHDPIFPRGGPRPNEILLQRIGKKLGRPKMLIIEPEFEE